MKEGIGLVLLPTLVGLGMVGQHARGLVRALRARRWQPTDGVVLSSRAEGLPTTVLARGGPRTAVPRVRYKYSVAGRRYRGEVVSFFGFGYDEAIETASQLERGHRVRVWFDPRNPASAVLDRGPTKAAVLQLLGGGALLLIGGVALPALLS